MRGDGVPERCTAFAPGRVNLIGEHTDYNDGLSLPFAIEQGVTVIAERTGDREIEAVARDLGERDRFPVRGPARASGWRAYVRGTVAELGATGRAVPGARLEISGTVPRGSGLSSSAALEVALVLALLGLRGEDGFDPVETAAMCSRVEHRWVGARTGLLDQLASLLGREGHAVRIDFRTLDARPVPLRTAGWTLVTMDSGERHAHGASAYNARRAECAEAARLLGVRSLRDADPGAAAGLPEPLGRRARHVTEENRRVDATVRALERGDLPAVARLLDESHASLRDGYDASTTAVEATIRRMRGTGAAGARMVGGGFGGHVLALFPPGKRPPDGARPVRPSAGARLAAG